MGSFDSARVSLRATLAPLRMTPGPTNCADLNDHGVVTWQRAGPLSSTPGGLRLLFNVQQDPHVNLMHDLVGPFAPIHLRPEVVLIPCRSLQQCLVIAQGYQPELAVPRAHVVVLKMRRRDLP